MALGDYGKDQALNTAWQEFCQRLASAGEQVFKDHNPGNDLQRADAFRFLTQNLGQAFDLALESKNTQYPQIHAFCTPNRKLGSDAADLTYRQAWIDGKSVYRLRGKLGSARFFNITVQGKRHDVQANTGWPSLHEPFGDTPEANIFKQQIAADKDGHFELIIGGEAREQNWLPTTPESRKLFIREGFDAMDETPTSLSIERIDMDSPRPLPDSETMNEAMDWAGDFLTGMMRDWPDHPYQYTGGIVDPKYKNQFPPDKRADSADDTKRGRLAAHLCWEIADDEALIVEFDNHNGFWMLSLSGAFMNSFDFLYRQVSLTPARAASDSDGKVRVILSHQDLGYQNWLDTQGFAAGNLTYRNLQSQNRTAFNSKLVKLNELAAALPSDTATMHCEQRQSLLKQRPAAIQQRYT